MEASNTTASTMQETLRLPLSLPLTPEDTFRNLVAFYTVMDGVNGNRQKGDLD